MIKTIFGKGTYFIGDICYALNEKIYDDIWGKKHGYRDGCFEVEKSSFVVARTAYGDGCYKGSDGVEYGVDAGVIGIVPKELWEKKSQNYPPTGGRIVTVKKVLSFQSDGKGLFEICIDGMDLIIETD